MAVRDELKRVIAVAKELGWEVGRTKSGHYHFTKPGRRAVFHSGTPSDPRANKNAIAKIRRHDRVDVQSQTIQ
jgi:predicted RNA binding protein YcfA (HicA-like mRNA interferase family)